MRQGYWLTTAVTVTAALAVGSCGGSDGLEKAALAKKANTICRQSIADQRKLGQPDLTDPAQAADYFIRAKGLAQKRQEQLRVLEPASEVKADYQKLLDASSKATQLIGDLAVAAREQDRTKSDELIAKLTPLSQQLDDAANAIGAADCTS